MGYAVTWCAVPERDAEDFLQRLRLSPTGEVEEIPESLVTSAKLATGWRIVWYNEYDCPFLTPTQLRELSKHHAVLVCLIEEHVMASSSEHWSGGKRDWWISHKGESGPKGLALDGRPPESFAAIKSQLEAQQLAEGGEDADVDYIFEIPLKVAQATVGFKHDEDCPHLVGGQFAVLAEGEPRAKKGLLQRLFSRR
jgi:hypothetical protein